MKRLWMLMMCAAFPAWLSAQQQAGYNQKGDDAMKRQDYSDAKMWYEEGVAQCDAYSIEQLTAIWKNNARMRPSMRSLMNKCLNCLNVKATEKDTVAVTQLITYYQEGIGTPKNEELAAYWIEQLNAIRRQEQSIEAYASASLAPRERMRFFIGYNFSPTAPFGISFGGVGSRLGWFARFKTNLSFQNFEEGKSIADFTQHASYEYIEKQANTFAATAGMVIRCAPWLYTSVALGYGKHELLYHYRTYDHDDISQVADVWCRQDNDSFKGVAADVDFMVRLGLVYVSAGCNTVNFKYVDLNAGLGFFF